MRSRTRYCLGRHALITNVAPRPTALRNYSASSSAKTAFGVGKSFPQSRCSVRSLRLRCDSEAAIVARAIAATPHTERSRSNLSRFSTARPLPRARVRRSGRRPVVTRAQDALHLLKKSKPSVAAVRRWRACRGGAPFDHGVPVAHAAPPHLDDQQSMRHSAARPFRGFVVAARQAGIKRNVVPSARLDCTSIRPPCAFTTSFECRGRDRAPRS